MFLDPILNSISDLIKEKEVFLVGGYLRNYFLNNEISPDRDLVVLEKLQIDLLILSYLLIESRFECF